MKVLSRIDPLSVMKVGGIIYGCLGLLMGLIFAIFFSIGAMVGNVSGKDSFPITGAMGVVFGGMAIIIFPIFYGVLGALIGGLLSVIYNLVARKFGGVVFELSEAEDRLRATPVAS
jgi:hypothetical protein